MSLECHFIMEDKNSVSLLLVLTSEKSALEDEVIPPLVLHLWWALCMWYLFFAERKFDTTSPQGIMSLSLFPC